MDKNNKKSWFDSHVIVEGLSPAENKKIKKLLEETFIDERDVVGRRKQPDKPE